MDFEKSINQLLELIPGTQAHASMEKILDGLTVEIASEKHKDLPYTIWQLVEHIRIAQEDILSFTKDPKKYQSRQWPDEYWPEEQSPSNQNALRESIDSILQGIESMKDWVDRERESLMESIPHSQGQTLLREAILLSQHNAYHAGQIVILRRFFGDWE